MTTRADVYDRTRSAMAPYVLAVGEIESDHIGAALVNLTTTMIEDVFPLIVNTITDEVPCSKCQTEQCNFGRALETFTLVLVGALWKAKHTEEPS